MAPPRIRGLVLVLLALLLALPAAGCGRDRPAAETAQETTDTGAFPEEDLSGTVRADGSSTVAPLVSLAAERFRTEEPGVKVTVGISGTGGGFERFCRGETDLANASRPIKDEEIAACKKKGIDYLELQVANDGLTVVINNGNDWAKCLTVEQLKKVWQPGSKIKNWKEIDPSFPSQALTLFGAGTDSGTFDYFTDAIVGEEGASRSDYTATEDDNVTVRGVAGEKGALGYFGLSYYESNKSQAEGSRDRRRRRLRRAERRDRAGRHVQAAVAAALHVRQEVVGARQAGGGRVSPVPPRQPGDARERGPLRAADERPARKVSDRAGRRGDRRRLMFTRFSQDVHPTGTQPLRASTKNGVDLRMRRENE